MTVAIPLKSIQLTPGSSVTIKNLTWQDFETILTELGEQRRVRLTYFQGNLEIMSPKVFSVIWYESSELNQDKLRMRSHFSISNRDDLGLFNC
ncbi:MAG: hypothetical protein QNJ55_14800 [Xenococcus sp. MO_188.B8]|nr:hypothetical protein [Xenococcus sp. MO_188.B8]